jgi:uncharacterized protein YPO0396
VSPPDALSETAGTTTGTSLRPGFRLDRVEVLNWGTFHKHIWGLDLGGNNALLTGDIGSGKSTLVDAVTALMIPRANFNKAAGASAGERSIETYFFGRYKSERGEPGLSSKPVSLRGTDSYSVLLGRFFNEVLAQHVTLAQVFWANAPQGPPACLFIVADKPLSIKEHFAGFGPDINSLRKRLPGASQIEIYDAFPPYGSAYRHRFGIENEQAMDLFHQTISMKSVGNLTDFVREHMLEGSPVVLRKNSEQSQEVRWDDGIGRAILNSYVSLGWLAEGAPTFASDRVPRASGFSPIDPDDVPVPERR